MSTSRTAFTRLHPRIQQRTVAIIRAHYEACARTGVKSDTPPEIILKEAIECAKAEQRSKAAVTDYGPGDDRTLDMCRVSYEQYVTPLEARSRGGKSDESK